MKNLFAKTLGLVNPDSKEDLEAALEKFNAEVEVANEEVQLGEVEVTDVIEDKQMFGDVTLEDGTVLYFPGEELTEGSKLYTDEDQTESAPAGSHTLDNGDVIELDEEGFVVSIESAGDPEEEVEEDLEQEEDTQAQGVEEILAALAPVLEDFEARILALESGNEELSKQNESLKEDLSKAEAKAEKLGKLPAAEKFTAAPKQSFTHLTGQASIKARLGIK